MLLSTPGRAAVLAAAVGNNGGRLRRGAAQAPQHKIDLNIKLKQMVKEQEKVRLVVLQPTLRMAEDVPIDVNGQTLLGVHAMRQPVHVCALRACGRDCGKRSGPNDCIESPSLNPYHLYMGVDSSGDLD